MFSERRREVLLLRRRRCWERERLRDSTPRKRRGGIRGLMCRPVVSHTAGTVAPGRREVVFRRWSGQDRGERGIIITADLAARNLGEADVDHFKRSAMFASPPQQTDAGANGRWARADRAAAAGQGRAGAVAMGSGH